VYALVKLVGNKVRFALASLTADNADNADEIDLKKICVIRVICG